MILSPISSHCSFHCPATLNPYISHHESPSQTFDNILNIIAKTSEYATGDFLAKFLSSPPHPERVTGRSLRRGKMLEMLVRGNTTLGVGELLQVLHCAAREFRSTPAEESLDARLQGPPTPITEAQLLCSYILRAESQGPLAGGTEGPTNPHAGFHVVEPRKPGVEEIKLHLSWDTYGATTRVCLHVGQNKH